MSLLDDTLATITSPDHGLEAAVQAHLDDLTKPPGSLCRLEEIAMRYCLATGTTEPRINKKAVFTFAGDHGVADAGVSAFPKEVTPQMVLNMLAGGAAINVLGRQAGAEVHVVDIGVADPLDAAGEALIRRKVRSGTDNIAEGPAMSVEEVRKALEVGVELARSAADDGVTLLGTGEMGIANTTPSSALFAALLPCDVQSITGRGTGIDDDRLKHKVEVIRKALDVNAGRLGTPLETLAALGGLEIAGICGLILGAAAARVPVVVDGFISSAAALVACKMKPEVADYLFFSHMSAEAGHRTFFEKFGTRPLLDLGLRLGEGTGAALAMMLVEASIKIYNEMATFSSAGVANRTEE
jgi:nicotinate-nucleotide--dimethylbenzimidazole phosphoribosyltransferase